MKERLDLILLELKLVNNRNKAKGLIMDGKILVNGEKITKPGTLFSKEKINIEIIYAEKEFVSRAGQKLNKAIKEWNLDLEDKVCLDIGASTGGFTDCCLQYGAKYVYAVDVGYNQLDWRLRSNPKVKSMEKTNFRFVDKAFFSQEIDFFCCDVSFISLEKIFKPLENIIRPDIYGIVLIKPQFECDREDINYGKVNSKEAHIKAITRVCTYANKNNFSVIDINWSPILGNKKNNIEFICLVKKEVEVNNKINENFVEELVNKSWEFFKKNG